MKSTIGLCKLKRKSGGYKYPKLSETCDFFNITERDLTDATISLFDEDCGFHDARKDTVAVYLVVNKAIEKYGLFNEIKEFL